MSLCLISSMGYSCDINFSLGVIAFDGVTVAGTLGGGTVTGTLGGTIVGTFLGNTVHWVFYGCMVLNIFSNLLMACNWLSPIVKGVCGPGCFVCVSVPWKPWWLTL